MASKKQAVKAATTASPASQDEPARPAKKCGRKPGDPNNTGRSRDPKWTRAMKAAIVASRRGRRRRLAGHLADARRTVAECGMADSPLGERIAHRLAQIEHEIGELGSVVERVGGSGRVKRDGTLSPAYEKRLSLIRDDRAELRALVDRLAEVLAAKPKEAGDIIYRAHFADGTPVFGTFVDAPRSPLPADPLAAMPSPSVETIAPPGGAGEAQTTLRDEAEPIGTPSAPRKQHPLDQRSPFARGFDRGDDLDF